MQRTMPATKEEKPEGRLRTRRFGCHRHASRAHYRIPGTLTGVEVLEVLKRCSAGSISDRLLKPYYPEEPKKRV